MTSSGSFLIWLKYQCRNIAKRSTTYQKYCTSCQIFRPVQTGEMICRNQYILVFFFVVVFFLRPRMLQLCLHRRQSCSIKACVCERDGACTCSLWCRPQGIERLKGETGRWGKVPCWEAMQTAFGGRPSPSWFSPFTGLSCQNRPVDHVPVPQGDIIEQDIIEIPLTPTS